MRFVAMNTGQRAERFIHTTVARDKVLVRSRIYNKQAICIVTDFCMAILRPSGCSKNYEFDIHIFRRPDLPAAAFVQYLSIW